MLALPKNRTKEREVECGSAIMLFARRTHGTNESARWRSDGAGVCAQMSLCVCMCSGTHRENNNKIIYGKNNYLKKHLKANACTEYKHTATTHLRALVRSTITESIASLSGYNSAHYINMDTIALYLYSWNCYKCCSVEQSLQFHFSGSECAAFFSVSLSPVTSSFWRVQVWFGSFIHSACGRFFLLLLLLLLLLPPDSISPSLFHFNFFVFFFARQMYTWVSLAFFPCSS